MCGLVGVFCENASQILLDSLRLLQYRGYDSYGVATAESGKIYIQKKLGAIESENMILPGKIGIAHTRWATHGKVSLENTHPFLHKNLAVAQNGIIENAAEIRAQFSDYQFESETDTEVVLPLLSSSPDLTKVFDTLQGSFAILAMDAETESIKFMVRGVNPLFIGRRDGMVLLGSDQSLFSGFSEVIDVEDGQYGVVTENSTEILSGKIHIIALNFEKKANKKTHDTWFETEFFAQTKIMRDAFNQDIIYPDFNPKQIAITGCGSAYYAGCVAQYWLRDIIPTNAYIAPDLPNKNDTVLCISQSGETADLLRALKNTTSEHVVAFLNNIHSSATKYSDYMIPIHAGEEISVASTKATMCQMVSLLRYAMHLGLAKHNMEEVFDAIDAHQERICNEVKKIAHAISGVKNLIIIARGILYPIACEAALKIKELAYIHAEAIPSSELKHGPLALIDKNSIVICLAPEQDGIISEIHARGGRIILFSGFSGSEIYSCNEAEYVVQMPKIELPLSPFLYLIPMQWLAFCLAKNRGANIDMPRNLAKSVTVE